MAENPNPNHQNLQTTPQEPNSTPRELHFDTSSVPNGSDRSGNDLTVQSDSRVLGTVGSNAARYKLMSPAKLPISRSPCLTIPPGLSPTSLLDSPVLLSMKAEPSPTTGTFFNKPRIMHDTGVSDSLGSPRDNTNTTTYNERSCGGFEFKPHIRSSLSSGLSSMGHMKCEPFGQIQVQSQAQSFASSPSAKNEDMPSSHELNFLEVIPLSVANPNQPVYTLTSDPKGAIPLTASERSSEDGYNWRKYGQKHVKGCEFPRSYYKCTHPNCQVKKQLERSQDGHITEIIYKGNHDHPKPQPNRRNAIGTVFSGQEDASDRFSPLNSSEDKSSIAHGHTYHLTEPNGNHELSPVTARDDNVEGADGPSNRILNEDDDDDDDPDSKRRKKDICGVDVTLMGKVTREPRVVVQTLSEVDILDDGYRWRKYGQKVVKGNPNPRSYYKCTNAGCPVRKHVERASHDPKAVITTYEGKHNHDVPAARNSAHDAAAPIVYATAANGMPRTRSEEMDTISLDLGVGINSSPENQSNEIHQAESAYNHTYIADPGCRDMIQAYCGRFNDGNGQNGSREGRVDSFSFATRPLNHSSNPYQQNLERLMMGP